MGRSNRRGAPHRARHKRCRPTNRSCGWGEERLEMGESPHPTGRRPRPSLPWKCCCGPPAIPRAGPPLSNSPARAVLSKVVEAGDSQPNRFGSPSNWIGGQLPGASDVAVIPALNTGASVTHSAGCDTVQSVSSGAGIVLTDGTLNVTGSFQDSSGATLTLRGGTLKNAAVTGASGLTLTSAGGTLDGLTVNGPLDSQPIRSGLCPIHRRLPIVAATSITKIK
jgi:hypothetical protein